jgi:predicted transcriptional regulator
MRNSFCIGEISDLLGIPKSTLRYWESEGLIDRQRDDNNYRKYYPSSMKYSLYLSPYLYNISLNHLNINILKGASAYANFMI